MLTYTSQILRTCWVQCLSEHTCSIVKLYSTIRNFAIVSLLSTNEYEICIWCVSCRCYCKMGTRAALPNIQTAIRVHLQQCVPLLHFRTFCFCDIKIEIWVKLCAPPDSFWQQSRCSWLLNCLVNMGHGQSMLHPLRKCLPATYHSWLCFKALQAHGLQAGQVSSQRCNQAFDIAR